MTLDDLASGLGIDVRVASDHLWQLGIVAVANTDLSGAMLTAAREYLATFAAHSRPAPPAIDAREPSDSAQTTSEFSDVNAEKIEQITTLNVTAPPGAHRIYELSQQTGLPTNSLIAAAHQIGIKADHVTQLTEGEIKSLWVVLATEPPEGLIEERVDTGIKRRRRIKTG